MWLFLAFAAVNLLILMEVADRLSLKGDLEIARDIQLAMLPGGLHQAGDAVVCGVTRPANTVGGDFYDILPRPDGRLVLALGDVAGKGSPAALLMALLLAMLRTLVDEGLDAARLLERLNVQVARHSPASRFITLFYGLYDPRDGSLEFVNAGHLPPIIRRADGRFERVDAPARAASRSACSTSRRTPRTWPASSPATCSCCTATGSPRPRTARGGRSMNPASRPSSTAKPRAIRKPSAAPCWPRSKPTPATRGWPTI